MTTCIPPDVLRRCLVLAGPTACGKTGLSLEWSEVAGGEIVAMDSMSLYRGMDIGTAKATSAERARVPHHLLDILDPHHRLNFLRIHTADQAKISRCLGPK